MRLLIRSLILSLIILSMVSVAARAQNVDDVAESFQAGLSRLVGEVPDRPARLALWSGPEKGMPVAASVIYGFEADLQKALLNLKPAPEILARSEQPSSAISRQPAHLMTRQVTLWASCCRRSVMSMRW